MRAVILSATIAVAVCAAGCPAPQNAATASGADSAPQFETGNLGEAVVGTRVAVRGRITRVQDDSPYGHKLWVDDGTGEAQVFIDASTDLIRHTNAWRVGDEVRVTGAVSKYQSLFELLPSVASDMVVLDRPSD